MIMARLWWTFSEPFPTSFGAEEYHGLGETASRKCSASPRDLAHDVILPVRNDIAMDQTISFPSAQM